MQYLTLSDFPVSQGSAEALGRWGGRTQNTACFLSNISLPKIIKIGLSKLQQAKDGTCLGHIVE